MLFTSSSVKNCYCAFCKSERRVYTKKNVSLINFFAALLGAAAFNTIIFHSLDPKGLMIFVGFLSVTEVFLQVRWRLAMPCRHCGFDPILYLKNVDAAVAQVQRRLESRKKDPASILSAPLNLPSMRKKNKNQKESVKDEVSRRNLERSAAPKVEAVRGRLLSKQL